MTCHHCKAPLTEDADGWIEEDVAEVWIPPDGDNVLVHIECLQPDMEMA